MADEPLPEHRVAITVFATTTGVNVRDAANVARAAIRQAIAAASESPAPGFPLDIPVAFRDECRPVQIVGVMETGAAAGDGYLRIVPTARAFREATSGAAVATAADTDRQD